MPAYSTLCPTCGERDVIYRKIADRDNLPTCFCGATVERIVTAPMVAIFPKYESPVDGRPITSRGERAEDLRRAGAYEWEPGIDKDIARKKQYNLESSNAEIGKAVDDVVRELNNCGKLENLNA